LCLIRKMEGFTGYRLPRHYSIQTYHSKSKSI
jgi:hypothetical protein